MSVFNNFIPKNKWKFIENGYGNESSLDSTDVETFKKDPIASLARESCQNSIDARKNENPVKIVFKSFIMKTSNIPGIKELKEELIACRNSYQLNTKYYRKFDSMISCVERDEILCLRISDFNTKGLEGVATNDRNKAFYYLTKGNGLTTKISSNSGGSKGIGKFASFVASDLQTVFYATLNENNEKGYIGISKLASRLLNQETGMCTTGYGYYCRTEKVLPILETLVLDNEFTRNEYGTDIYIIGFRAEENWRSTIISKILDSFMCAIQFGDLEVEVDGILINNEKLQSIIYNDSYIIPSEKKNIMAQYILLNNDFVHTKSVNIKGYGEVKIYLKDFDKQEENLATNKCVMVRYPYMKITDFKIPFAKPCSALCIIEKNELNSMLREVENPQHTDWEPNRITDDTELRREIKRVIKEIKEQIQIFADEVLLSGDKEEIDIDGAGDYLADQDFGNDNIPLLGEEIIEQPKVVNSRRTVLKNNIGDNSEEGDNSSVYDIGSHEDEGDESPTPSGNNKGTGSEVHEGDETTGYNPEGDDEVLRSVQLSGMKVKTILLDKEHGKYLVVFNSIYNENNCDLELYYLDDKGGKYIPNVTSAYINGNPARIDNNKIKSFNIQNGVNYKVEINTDLDDLYACEVRIYANR